MAENAKEMNQNSEAQDSTANEMKPFFADLNDLLELNCIQAALAEQARSVIGSAYRENYTDTKVSYFNNARNELFDIFLSSRDEVDVNFEKQFQMASQRDFITEKLKQIYGVEGKFEDFFDWFEIKFEPYKKETEKMYLDFKNYADNCSDDLAMLHIVYNEYLESLRFFVVKEACKKIARTLNDEFKGNGFKSLYYGVPLDQDVEKLKASVIEDVARKVYTLELKCQELYKKELKRYKKCKNPEEFDDRLLMDYQDDLHFAGMLTDYMEVLQNRISKSNKVSLGAKSTIKIAVIDFLCGVPQSQKTNGRDWVYVHKGEIKYVNYLFEKLKNSPTYQQVFKTENAEIIQPEK